MKPEAPVAMAGDTMRSSALEAATVLTSDASTAQVGGTSSQEDTIGSHLNLSTHVDAAKSKYLDDHSNMPKQPSTPFGQRIGGTESATKIIKEVVHGVKVAVDGAVAWAEKKAEELSSVSDNYGPYTSPAKCAPSDLNPIASGALPIMSTPKKATEEEATMEQTEEEKGITEGKDFEEGNQKVSRAEPP
jgi:hypothetical protein